MNKKTEIQKHYDFTCNLAIELIEETARKVMAKHPSLVEYIQGMGSWFFVNKKGDYLDGENAICKPIDDIMQKWDEYLHLTGYAMRFTATGQKITQW